MNGQLFSQIRTKYYTLSDSQKGVADYILDHPDRIMVNTLNETSMACGVSETTVLRFLRKIGFTSYQVFKINVTQELAASRTDTVYSEINFSDSPEQIKEKVIRSTLQSIDDSRETISAQIVDEVTDKIIAAQKLLIVGVGASGCVASDFYHKMIKLKINAVFSQDPHMINILSNNLDPNDLLIVISHSGASREVLDAVDLAKSRKCEVCAVTSYANSALAHRSQYVLCSSSLETKFRSDAMTSRIIQIVITDIIYTTILVKKGEGIMDQVYRSRLAVAKNKV